MSSFPVDDELLPIGEVARRLGLRPSAIRYYEDRGLIEPTQWRGGQRWFDRAAVRRLAVIQLWKQAGLLSLDGIASFLAGDVDDWASSVDAHIEALTAQIGQLEQARDFLRHVRHHHQTTTPDGCPHYEALLDELC
ncbi:MerR family copper efflux transcriptional regulator [Mycobacterium sp. MAA66]|uniref:MerR family transcriptional regulator n=1 Tax=Mycobacterium sp. MAA66 TaxID=3156297 RepID=UPI003513736C